MLLFIFEIILNIYNIYNINNVFKIKLFIMFFLHIYINNVPSHPFYSFSLLPKDFFTNKKSISKIHRQIPENVMLK